MLVPSVKKVYLNAMKYNRIKVILAEKDMTSMDIVKGLSVNKTTVSRWINNKAQPSVETFYKIAELLDVDVKDLFVSTKTD